MKFNREVMTKARAIRKQQRLEEMCDQHEFLACEKPNMVLTRTGYDTHVYIAQGVIKYHKCSICGKEVGG